MTVEELTHLIHTLEMEEWPKISADPEGGCLNGDRCAFVAAHILTKEKSTRDKLTELLTSVRAQEAAADSIYDNPVSGAFSGVGDDIEKLLKESQ